MEVRAMWADAALEEEDGDRRLPARAVAAALAALCAAALAADLLGGAAAPGRLRGRVVPAAAVAAGPAAAPEQPAVARMRFHGPGGELLELAPVPRQ